MLSISSHYTSTLPSTAQFTERLNATHNKEQQTEKDAVKTPSQTDSTRELSEQKQLQTLKIRDREVRAHELAHASVGGQFASGPSFTYQKGTDGVLYAVAGEVAINSSAIQGDPKATLEKAQIIQRAALAPADPSTQDRSVASSAAVMAQNARVEISQLIEIENSRELSTPKENAEEDKSIDVYA